MIVIVDYGMGNLGSILNIFRYMGVQVRIASDAEEVVHAEKIVLPGVGAFDAAMERIDSIVGLREILDRKVLIEQIPTLGVCLGMQILTNGSDEGQLPGLGWIPGCAKRFPKELGLKVPHMGWNLAKCNVPSPLTSNLGDDARYYFVHSYFVSVENSAHSLLRTTYGIDFDSGIGRKNIFGLQFHPEKSHRFGMQILNNFASL